MSLHDSYTYLSRRALESYFTEDASFNHPLCSVEPRPGSRDAILGIYQ